MVAWAGLGWEGLSHGVAGAGGKREQGGRGETGKRKRTLEKEKK